MQIFDFIVAHPVYAWFVLISAAAFIVTVYDKLISKKKGKRRVSEAALLMISVLGGSLSMYATMLFIRHKTKHKKFMIGLPAIMILQAAAIVLINLKK